MHQSILEFFSALGATLVVVEEKLVIMASTIWASRHVQPLLAAGGKELISKGSKDLHFLACFFQFMQAQSEKMSHSKESSKCALFN